MGMDHKKHMQENRRSRNSRAMRRSNSSRILYVVIAITILVAALILFARKAQTARAEEAQPSYKYYTTITLEKGDSLWSIAEKYSSDQYKNVNDYIAEVKELNHLTGSEIHAGEYLTIPYYSEELK